MIRQWEVGQKVRVRPILHLPATPSMVYRQRVRHTYPATVVETLHHPVGTFIRVQLDEHEHLALSDAERMMLVPPAELHPVWCDCRRCKRRPSSRGLDYPRARWRRWTSVAWAKYENLFDY
jgi:hypothetical protein